MTRYNYAEADRAVLAEMALLILQHLDPKRESVARRLRRRFKHSQTQRAFNRLFEKNLIRIVEKRSLGEVVYAPTDEGWALSGHKKPFWLEVAG